MERKFQYYPDKGFYTIEELQERLQFTYVPLIAFENALDRQEVLQRGLEKLQAGGVTAEALELGARYIEKIQASYIPEVSVRMVGEEVGYGLFAEEEIEAGAYVGEYTGIVRKNDRRYTEPLNNYCYQYPVPDHIGRDYVVDATQGCLTRFINHSYTPNLRPVHVFYEGYYHLIFLAIKRIEKGAQLSFNYGKNYWYVRSAPLDFN